MIPQRITNSIYKLIYLRMSPYLRLIQSLGKLFQGALKHICDVTWLGFSSNYITEPRIDV
jgi:hypothetical protein